MFGVWVSSSQSSHEIISLCSPSNVGYLPSLVSCGVGSQACHPSNSFPKSGRLIQQSTQTWKFLEKKRVTTITCLLQLVTTENSEFVKGLCCDTPGCELTKLNPLHKFFPHFRHKGSQSPGWRWCHELIQSWWQLYMGYQMHGTLRKRDKKKSFFEQNTWRQHKNVLNTGHVESPHVKYK